MDWQKSGGPVFPCTREEVRQMFDDVMPMAVKVDYSGMTLRDYFAAKAIPPDAMTMIRNAVLTETAKEIAASFARSAYELADAMLEARDE